MFKYLVILVFIWTCLVQGLGDSIDRSDEVKYTVLVQNEEPQEPNGLLIPITSPLDKKKYNCWLPAPWTEDEPEEADAEIPSIPDLLEPLGKTCLYRIAGWWTYEFCYGKHMRQYHQEKDKPLRPQDEFYLGRKHTLASSTHQQHKDYYVEYYESGTVCDLTGEKRRSEVRYFCSKDKTTSTIGDIKEPSSCTYLISIFTPLMCKHPQFKPPKEKLQTISCIPLEKETPGGTGAVPSGEDVGGGVDSLGMSAPEDDPALKRMNVHTQHNDKKKGATLLQGKSIQTVLDMLQELDEDEPQVIEIPLEEFLAQADNQNLAQIVAQKLMEMNQQEQEQQQDEEQYEDEEQQQKKANVHRLG